ncbi:Conserved_hypothetical protein [Hexamita inflata]|uniref:Uncharacterized protein n=1 Tax=Hexamita inflata TaxID=28002 RepID=A0AA86UBV4_9EUKA|nr:Conserved hypothetical protein [Hexamita inflata]
MQLLHFVLAADVKSFKQCFSPSSSIVGNRLIRTIYLNLQPNPLMQFIPSDNMCQVLNGKSSTVVMKINSPLNGNVLVPASGPGIQFQYLYNKNISISYTFSTLADYDRTLDATFGGYSVLLDGEYTVDGSVADIFHTLSNQTSCFSTTYFSFSLIDNWYSFNVEPVFCDVPVFTPYFEFQIENKWERLQIHEIDPLNEFATGNEFSTIKTDFLTIKRYLLSPFSPFEAGKYSVDELKVLQQFIDLFKTDKTVNTRLSLDYPVKTNTGSITSVSFYSFSYNKLQCFNSMKIRASLNEQNLIFKTGLEGKINCLEITNTDLNYALAQNIKNKWAKVRIDVVVNHSTTNTYFYYDQEMSIQQFLSRPDVTFKIPQDELRDMMNDKSTTESTIQMFIEIQDENGDYLLDFNTPFITLVRTCIKEIVIHQKKDYTTIVSWMKNDSRCTSKPNLSTTLYLTGVSLNNSVSTLLQLYKTSIVVNYKANTMTTVVNCSQDLMHTQSVCETNRKSSMKPENSDNILYSYITTDEYASINYQIIDDTTKMWAISFGIFGGLILVVGVAIVFIIVKQQQ